MINKEIKADWAMIYTGIVKDWLSPEEALSAIESSLLNELTSSQVTELYISQDQGKDMFVKRLENLKSFKQHELLDAISKWGLYFLQNIYRSEKGIQIKLYEIADIWAMLDYPQQWKDFIYYMPVEEGSQTGNDVLYRKFQLFLEKNNSL